MSGYTLTNERASQDMDGRSILLGNSVAVKQKSYHAANGLVYLSKVGLHAFFVGSSSYFSWGRPYNSIKSWHFPLSDLQMRSATCTATTFLPLGTESFALTFGYQTTGGRGIFDGLQNLTTQKSRATFLESIAEVQRQMSPLVDVPDRSPLLTRMNYFANASIIGGAILNADLIIEGARYQGILQRGPGFFERGQLKSNGWKAKGVQFPPLSPHAVTQVKRRRAWMLLESTQQKVLLDECKKRPDSDAAVTAAYGFALATSDKRKAEAAPVLLSAPARDPQNAQAQAAGAWGLALQKRTTEAQQAINYVRTIADGDQYALLLLGCAEQEIGDSDNAVDHYVASAALSHGYYDGSIACQRALNLSIDLVPAYLMGTIKRLRQAAPMHPEPLVVMARVGEAIHDSDMVSFARAQLTAMMEG